MKKITNVPIQVRMLILMFVGLFFSSVSTAMASDEKVLKGYVIAQVDVKNQQDFFGQYGPKAGSQIVNYGGRVLAATFDKDVKEGVWGNNWTVVLEFPSIKSANAWYNSSEYQNEAMPIRKASTGYTNMVFVEEFKMLPPKI